LSIIVILTNFVISEFSNGQRQGNGTYKFSDGGRYEGSWWDGRYSGFGICAWEDGRCYKGYVLCIQLSDSLMRWWAMHYREWLNGMAHGKGVETFPDGTIRHDGQWVEDEPVAGSV
jgi:MORN repeat